MKALLLIAIVFVTTTNAMKLEEIKWFGDEYTMVAKKVPGREGSYFGLLIQDDKKVRTYLLDELNATSYTMNPLDVTTDGLIGIQNDDPSNILVISKNKQNKLVAKITSANSSNQTGENQAIVLEAKDKETPEWIDIMEGEYKYHGDNESLSIGQYDVLDESAMATFMKPFSGTYKISQKLPGMYLLNAVSTLATGTFAQKVSRAIGVFVKTSGWGTTEKLILVNPTNEADLTIFKKD